VQVHPTLNTTLSKTIRPDDVQFGNQPIHSIRGGRIALGGFEHPSKAVAKSQIGK